METENKQLHQVILQLRNVRKVSKEDVDTLQAERDELKRTSEQYKLENAQLIEKLKVNEQSIEDVPKLQEDIIMLQEKVKEYEEARREGMLIIDEKKREVARLEKLVYDNQAAADVSAADIRMLNEDLDRKDLELQNLRNALTGTEAEQDQMKRILQNDFEKKLASIESKFKTEITENDALWEVKLKEAASLLKSTDQLLQDAKILQRKAELDLSAEKKRMQKTVEHAISQMRNTADDVVDRALLANLLVSYFKRNRYNFFPRDIAFYFTFNISLILRSREVMDLIAKVLNFNDDQKVVVGLKVGNVGFRHTVGKIFNTIVGTPPVKSPQEIEGENLAELWVNFLMTETGDNGRATDGRLSRSPLSIRTRISGMGSGSDTDHNESEETFGSISLVPSSPTIAKANEKISADSSIPSSPSFSFWKRGGSS